MALNPHAQRPRLRGWPRPYNSHISLSVLEFVLLKRYAEREGLALGAAVRELALAGLTVEKITHPDRDDWAEALERARYSPWTLTDGA